MMVMADKPEDNSAGNTVVTRPEDALASSEEAVLWSALSGVMDPEVPALSIIDLGIVRAVRVSAPRVEGKGGVAEIDVTPTYTGCPATALINEIIMAASVSVGFGKTKINLVLSPAWTTDWISTEAREKLRAYGIAPPSTGAPVGKATLFGALPVVTCPQCGSQNTEQVSEFGATACKAMYRCKSCFEPFEYFKCI